MAHPICADDLLVRVLVNNELLAPNGQHWVYDTPLFGLSLEATGTHDTGQLVARTHLGGYLDYLIQGQLRIYKHRTRLDFKIPMLLKFIVN